MRLYVAWLLVWLLPYVHGLGYSHAKRDALREEVRELFRHGFRGYMKYAYPADELKSVSCKPSSRSRDPEEYGINDIHANVSMTLLDVLSTLPLVDPQSFPDALQRVATEVSFDQDVKVQVFELTIRALGALLSTVEYLDALPPDVKGQADKLGIKEKEVGGDLKRFRGRMLELAVDLGERLIPAFETLTGMPYSRINLRKGVEKGESQNTCAAGAGSLTLEFAVLSRLTGDKRFEALATRAYLAVWNRASTHGLVGNTIGVSHGQWLLPGMSGIGAGIDSFFEYGIKTGILLNDDSFLDIFYDSYAAVQTHVRSPDGFIYRPTQYQTLRLGTTSSIDSLSAFVSGMQVLAGDLESAIKSHLVYWNLWRRYSALPESWDWRLRTVEWDGWPGRPEFIESTYYLYKATGDPFYLKVGERFMKDLKKRIKTKCGFATLSNLQTGELQDRMESFVLSETLKYLYLLFDRTPTKLESNQVFSTEGHPLSLPTSLLGTPSQTRRILHRGEVLQCPAYVPPTRGGLIVGIEQRPDYEYARKIVFGPGEKALGAEDGEVFWSEYGFCAKPQAAPFTIDISLLPPNSEDGGQQPPEDLSPSSSKVRQDEATGDYYIHDSTGLRLTLRWRLDNQGYNVASIGPHRVRTGQQVIVTDAKMQGYLPVASPGPEVESHQSPELILRFSNVIKGQKQVVLHALGATATFGRDFDETRDAEGGWRVAGGSMPVFPLPYPQRFSCEPLSGAGDVVDKILLVERGECTFAQKMIHAQAAGAAGVIVVDQHPDSSQTDQQVFHEGGLVRPSSEEAPEEEVKALGEVRERAEGEGKVETGMIFVTSVVGGFVRTAMTKGDVVVDLMATDVGMGDGWEDNAGAVGGGGGGGGKQREPPREGRLAIGEWEIFNLKIVEG